MNMCEPFFRRGATILLFVAVTGWAQGPGAPPVVEWTPDGKILIAAGELLARFDLDAGKEELLDRYGDTFAISPDGKCLALARGTVVEVRSYPKLAPEVQVWPPEGAVVVSLAWSPDGKVLAGGTEDGRVLLWALDPGELQTVLETASAGVVRLKFSSDGKRLLVIAASGRAVLWDLVRQKALHQFTQPREENGAETGQTIVQDMNAQGSRVLATRIQGEGSDVLLLDDRGREVWKRAGYALEFTRDGEGVLALSWPFRIAAHYRASDAGAVQIFEPPPEVILLYFVRQSPDRKFLLGVGEDKRGQVLVLWEFETARLLAVHR